MAYTPDELIRELHDLGYPVTKRRLTDWSQKGLLPSPRPRGRGQGRGKEYRWEEPDMLHRAIDVFELLEWHRRAQDLFLPLWVLGYNVPVTEVRTGLEKHVNGLARGLDAAIPHRGDRSDLVSDLVSMAEEQQHEQPDVFPTSLLTAVLHGFIDPASKDWERILTDLRETFALSEAMAASWIGAAGAESVVALIRDLVSVPQLQAAVELATDDDLARVHRDLKGVAQAARVVANVGMDIESSMQIRILVGFGIRGAVVDLALRRGGYGAWVDQSIGAFVDGCHRLLTDPRLRAEMQRLRAEAAATTADGRGEDDDTEVT